MTIMGYEQIIKQRYELLNQGVCLKNLQKIVSCLTFMGTALNSKLTYHQWSPVSTS